MENNKKIERFLTVVNIAPRDDKTQAVADSVFFTNETTLARKLRAGAADKPRRRSWWDEPVPEKLR